VGGLLGGRRLGWAVLGAACAVLPGLWMWAFTVDDALIAVRYARNLSQGLGWRFNPHGPSTDGVTSLSWPLVLAMLARADSWAVLDRAKTLGLIAWGITGAGLGVAIGRVEAVRWPLKLAVMGTLTLSVPMAAYAVSGMETPLATALATGAALCVRRSRVASRIAGCAALFRPEMAVWATVLAVASTLASQRRRDSSALTAAVVAMTPSIGCVVARVLIWGRPVPLAVLAKPGTLEQGFAYAGAACIVSLVPVVALAPLALYRDRSALAIALAALAHVGTVAFVGGDWMPFARLIVPVVPSLAYASVLVAPYANRPFMAARSVLAALFGATMIGRGSAEAARHVGPDRAALIALARPRLAACHSVAALDIGWVGAATDSEVIDLAGLTDPYVAALPGGHTSKRVGTMFLLDRGADSVIMYLARGLPNGGLDRWTEAEYSRVVEARLARDPIFARHYAPQAWLPLGAAGAGYVLFRARPPTE